MLEVTTSVPAVDVGATAIGVAAAEDQGARVVHGQPGSAMLLAPPTARLPLPLISLQAVVKNYLPSILCPPG